MNRCLRSLSGASPLRVLPFLPLAGLLLALSPIRPGGRLAAQAAGGVVADQPVEAVVPTAWPRPRLRAVRAGTPVVIDGVIDDAVWQTAEPVTTFIQSTPRIGFPVSEATEVRVLYDDRYLYIGAVLYDRDPGGIVHKHLEKDYFSPNDDGFGVALDTFLDRRNGYYFFVNPNGAVRDGLAYDNSRSNNVEWQGGMIVRSTIHDQGWSVEIGVPLSMLRYDPALTEQDWGLQLTRRIRRRNEEAFWAPVDVRKQIHAFADAGTLEGLTDLPRNRNLMVKPYVAGTDIRGTLTPALDRGVNMDAGLDVKYGVTPRLTMDLTWRTDFSQVEVDQEQVNLTRFSLFFPENREFFVENSGTFAFGDQVERNVRLGAGPRDFTLFHSRRIGLHQGQPVPILGGGRLSGRPAGFEVGLLNMQTETSAGLPAENFTVARLRRPMFGGADLGGIFINRQPTDGSGGYSRSWGVDANARLLDGMIVHSYLAGTEEPGLDGNNLAGRLSMAWRSALWNTSALFRQIGEDFRPGVGYVRRAGIRQHYATVGAHPRPRLPLVTELNPYVEVDYITGLDAALETRNLTGGIGAEFDDGSLFNLTYTDTFEDLDQGFQLIGQLVPAGRYSFGEAAVSYASSSGRPLAANLSFSRGGYFQGTRQAMSIRSEWRPSMHIALLLRAEHNVIDLGAGSFTADLFSARLNYVHSTTLNSSAWIQYNDADEELVTNARLHLIHSPLSDFFLVFAERRNISGGGVLDRRISAKLTRMLAF